MLEPRSDALRDLSGRPVVARIDNQHMYPAAHAMPSSEVALRSSSRSWLLRDSAVGPGKVGTIAIEVAQSLEPKVRIELTAYALPRRTPRRRPVLNSLEESLARYGQRLQVERNLWSTVDKSRETVRRADEVRQPPCNRDQGAARPALPARSIPVFWCSAFPESVTVAWPSPPLAVPSSRGGTRCWITQVLRGRMPRSGMLAGACDRLTR